MQKQTGKSPQTTAVQMSELVLPNDTNLLGNLLGGRLMHWIDIAAALVCSRHSNCVVATVSMDHLDFRHPIRMGELVILNAKMTYVGKTSMEVRVEVFAENLKTGAVIQTNKARLVFVALDDASKPTVVPPLLLETEEEKEAFAIAKERREKKQR